MGPHAHIEFERRLLGAIKSPMSDQDYPEWVVSSIPGTPDRTVALLENGPSPLPLLLRSLKRLAASADFAVLTCMTAHAFLEEIRASVRLPILDMAEATLAEVTRLIGFRARVGVLATTGALHGRVFQRAASRVAPDLELLSLLDLPDGGALQEELVMRPIYGPLREGRRGAGGIKGGGSRDLESRVSHRDVLASAVGHLAAAGTECVITGCTEIPLALGREPVDGIPLFDPLDITARAAVRIARGEIPLPLAGDAPESRPAPLFRHGMLLGLLRKDS